MSVLTHESTSLDVPTPRSFTERTGLPPAVVEDLLARTAERAPAIDRGEADLPTTLTDLGRRGLLGSVSDHGPAARLRSAGLLATLARGCLATAFATWAHLIAAEYLRHGGDALRDLRSDLLDGDVVGSTAMATAFQDAAGLREIGVHLTRRGDRVVLDGSIGWASNLHPSGFVVVLPARDDDGRRYVVAVPSDAPGLETRPAPSLLALGATASSGFALTGVELPRRYVVSDTFETFLQAVRRPFLLLQAAFCLGLAEEALTAARFGGPERESLIDDHRTLVARHERAAAGLVAELTADGPTDRTVVELRLEVARLAVDAVALEAKLSGGAGYLATSPTARRLREAAFVPIQSPTEAQLRWELQRSA